MHCFLFYISTHLLYSGWSDENIFPEDGKDSPNFTITGNNSYFNEDKEKKYIYDCIFTHLRKSQAIKYLSPSGGKMLVELSFF